MIAACGVALLTAGVAGAEEAKPSKPAVCLSYAIAKTDAEPVAICYDGKKPALYRRFAEVEVPGKESGRVRVLVGWR